ncbi:MAG: hypothetical protein ACD_36C00165G0001 [uncultured bacterium]|uniref:Erythromycin biosynthesis sensory transduction protein eryC1 n=1 Tax=Candidatus Gottesmanbacteria bacterium RIFCSPLOWO2_01_FULL_43_11b TaxID=1798392 RepID=A0A1F6AIF7_9BACT|nr:MAG: hypothetical protein ACD_36C00165G0001 [uncultured bacterium]OGG24504.1 MAG: hypothetical protein A3A79_04955 [Candidatus Gottesmanbacteria bacterium RIFCSPLOWO2_01_FULL_43_11b]
MKIAFVDLQRQNRRYRKAFSHVFNQTLKDSIFVEGKPVERFERQFADFCGKKYCVGLNSGTDAILFALLAYGISPGDEVITAPNSYFSPAMMISQIGAVPIFVDINPKSGNLDVSKIEKAITKNTKAIMPVHLCGQSADMDPIVKLAQKYRLSIIEDACQAHGARYKNKILPYTETGTFSFYPGKNLGSFGDAGAIVTDSKKIRDSALKLRNDGSTKKYIHTQFGYKSRLDTFQAAILSAKIPLLSQWNKNRRQAALLYNNLLSGIKQVKTPIEMPYVYHIYHLYMITCENRDGLQKYLESYGISTVIHYPIPIHLQKPYRKRGYKPGMYPVTEKRSKAILSLPMFPEITKKEIQFVYKTIASFYAV